MSQAKFLQNAIKHRMEELHLNIREMERKAGVKRGAIYNVVSGISENPTLDTLLRIAEVLECSIADLLSSDVSSKVQSKPLSNSKPLQWNRKLFVDTVQIVLQKIEEKKSINHVHIKNNIDTEQVLSIIREVYTFSLTENCEACEVNEKFVQWIIDSNFP